MRIPNASASPLSTRATTVASGGSSGACTYDLSLGGAVTLMRTEAQHQSHSATALVGSGRYGVAGHSQVAGRSQTFPADRAGECLEGGLRTAAVARVARARGQLEEHARDPRVGARERSEEHRLRAVARHRRRRVGGRGGEGATLRGGEIAGQPGGGGFRRLPV